METKERPEEPSTKTKDEKKNGRKKKEVET